jgi:hypothetical protein
MPLRKIRHPAGAGPVADLPEKELAEINLTDHAGVRHQSYYRRAYQYVWQKGNG